MYTSSELLYPPSRSSCRHAVVSNFDLLVHDLSCACDSADPGRAQQWLGLAGWTVREAYEGWYEWWMRGGSRG